MALAEKKAAGTVERAEARATSAEGSERDLRASVEAIKVDFEALVEDLRQRDKKIQHLETEREALAVQCAIFMSTASATVATKTGPTAVDSVGGSQERPDLSQEQRETGTPAGEKNMTETRELSDTPSPVGLPHESNSEVRGSGVEWSTNAEEKHPVKGFEAGKRRASHGDGVKVHPDRGRRRSMDNKRGARTIKFSQKSDTAAETQHRDRGTDPRSASTALPAGDGSRLQRKQLAPPTTVGLRRVSTMSYPHHGGRVTLTSASETSGLKDKITGGKAEKAPASTESGSAKRVPDEPSKAEDAEVSVPRTAKIPCPAPPMPRRPSSGSVTGRTATPTPAPTPTPPLPCHPRAEASLSAEDPRESVVHLSSSGERTESSDGRVALKSLTPTEPAADIYEEKGEEVCETDPQEGLAGPLATRSSLDIIVGNEEPRQVRGDVVLSTPTPTRLNDGDASGVVPTRLVDGVRVVKHSGRGKPRPKVLWVTPDLSEIFYTSVGRTNNAKQTSRMPLAELRIARGRGDCPELLRAHSDRCFALSRSDRGARSGSSIDDGSGADAIMSSTAPAATTSRGRKRWGFGGTPSPSEGHGIFWRGRTVSGVGGLRFFSGLGATTVRSGSGGGGGSGAGGGGGRERMGLETDSVEERDALVSEINELVRLASLRASLGDCSYRGRDLFDEWCRSSPLTGGA